MADETGEKSQEPTQHRRQQAREKGQVAQSQDLGSALLLLVAVLVMLTFGGRVIDFFGTSLVRHLGGPAWLAIDRDFLLEQQRWLLGSLAETILPILAATMIAGIVVNIAQVGFLWVPQRVVPDISRLSVLKGVKRLFSIPSVMRLSFGAFKVLVVAIVAAVSLYGYRDRIIGLTGLEIAPIAVSISEIVLWTCLRIGLALLILALLDYAFQRWKFEQDLKMTQQEVREEMKNLQGDPQILARRRAVQRQLVLNRLSQSVPQADVVITNPTELAIAIKYVPEEMAAPIVVAKGAGAMAQRIRRLALEHDIPIVEKKPLAQQLYKEVEVNQPISSELYAAVAEVLAYVYQLKGKTVPQPPTAA